MASGRPGQGRGVLGWNHMRRIRVTGVFLSLGIILTPGLAVAGGSQGAETTSDSSGGAAQISTWVIGAINGGVHKPVGTSKCTDWRPVTGPLLAGDSDGTGINPPTNPNLTLYTRLCDGVFQFVFVGPHNPTDVARVAYEKVAKLVPKPQVNFSPPADKMVVNFESWLGVTPHVPVTATAAIPGLSATVTARATEIEWTTGSKVAGDTTVISCQLWGSTQSAEDGCAWTPAYPSVSKVTGTDDQRYHGAVTIVWHVSWQATNGATGALGELRTTTPVEMGVREIQTIGG